MIRLLKNTWLGLPPSFNRCGVLRLKTDASGLDAYQQKPPKDATRKEGNRAKLFVGNCTPHVSEILVNHFQFRLESFNGGFVSIL